jgi:hypothetical protein
LFVAPCDIAFTTDVPAVISAGIAANGSGMFLFFCVFN